MSLTKEELNSLPAEVAFHLYSDKAIDISLLIADKYNFDSNHRLVLYQLIDKLFLKKIKLASLPTACERLFNMDNSTALKLSADIVGARLLVVEEWLQEDLKSLITNWGGNPASYAPHLDAQLKNKPIEEKYLKEELASVIKQSVVDDEESEIKPFIERVEMIKDIFSQGLTHVFKYDDADLIKDINIDVLDAIIKQGNGFENILVGAMFNNNEQLTSERIVLDGRLLDPTIGHWLELFVRIKGASLFDMVAAMDFITTNDNTKKLSAEEKELVIRLITTYRNLKFFPESQPGNEPSLWQIFPLPEEIDNEPIETGRQSVQLFAPVKPLDILDNKVVEKYEPVVKAPEIAKPSGLTVPEALRLQSMLAEFPEGSIERLAIEEELKKYK